MNTAFHMNPRSFQRPSLDVLFRRGLSSGRGGGAIFGWYIILDIDALEAEDANPNSSYAWGWTLVHEMGHYIFGLGDEYRDTPGCFSDPSKVNARGECIHHGAPFPLGAPAGSLAHQCIMQFEAFDPTYGQRVDATEFCHYNTHDRRTNLCGSALYTEKEFYVYMNEQHQRWSRSCWEHVAGNHTWMGSAPQATDLNMPSGPPNVVIEDRTSANNAVSLVFDTSGSMNAVVGSGSPFAEKCRNELDDDGDDETDETDCVPCRISELKEGADAFIDVLADAVGNGHLNSVNISLVTFDTTAGIVGTGSQPLTIASAPAFKNLVNDLKVNVLGRTNIGGGLAAAEAELAGLSTDDRTIVLFSDGRWNEGPDPSVEAARIRSAGIEISVFGNAAFISNDFVRDLQGQGIGTYDDAPGATILQFADVLSQHLGWLTAVPPMPIVLDQQVSTVCGITWQDFVTNDDSPCGTNGGGASLIEVPFSVPADSEEVWLVLVSRDASEAGLVIDSEIVDPNGQVWSTAAPGQFRAFFKGKSYALAAIPNPTPGAWRVLVRNAHPTVLTQDAWVSVRIDHPGWETKVAFYPTGGANFGPVLRLDNVSVGQGLLHEQFAYARIDKPNGSIVVLPFQQDILGGLFVELSSVLTTPGPYQLYGTSQSVPGLTEVRGREVLDTAGLYRLTNTSGPDLNFGGGTSIDWQGD